MTEEELADAVDRYVATWPERERLLIAWGELRCWQVCKRAALRREMDRLMRGQENGAA